MSGHSFQFAPNGIVAVEQGSNEVNETIIPANADFFKAPSPVSTPVKCVKPSLQQKPINVVKAAKRRLREVKKEITRLRKLERERDELTRLITAAEQKPCAIVRDIAAKRG